MLELCRVAGHQRLEVMFHLIVLFIAGQYIQIVDGDRFSTLLNTPVPNPDAGISSRPLSEGLKTVGPGLQGL